MVFPQFPPRHELHAAFEDCFYFEGEHIPGQPVWRDCQLQHAARFVVRVENGYSITALRQFEGSQQQQQSENEVTATPALSPLPMPEPVAEERYAGPNGRVIVSATARDSLTDEELEAIEEDPLLSRLQGDKVFVFDDMGVLSLYGERSIPLLGLSEADI